MSARKASYNLREEDGEDKDDGIKAVKLDAGKPRQTPLPEELELDDVGQSNGRKGDARVTVGENEGETDSRTHGICAPVDKYLSLMENWFKKTYTEHSSVVKLICLCIFFGLYIAYVMVACIKNFDKAVDLFAISMFALFCLVYWFTKKMFGKWIAKKIFSPIVHAVNARWTLVKWVSIGIVIILFILWVAIDTAKEPNRLMSLLGLFIFTFIGFLFSRHRSQVKWRPVIWGFGLQFVFGLLILRTDPGRVFFRWLGDRVTLFLSFSDVGAKFIFGNLVSNLYFAFKVLPVVIFFSAFVSMIYYLGIMQIVITKIAWLMQISMATSAAESLNAAGNIFIGQTESPLLIRPFLLDLTRSEIHAVMTGGFATIAGSVLGAYIIFGVSASHLLSASVMSAPAALALSKLMYPETKVPKTRDIDSIEIEKGEEKNFIEALASGASTSILLVANIAAMLIAFLSMKAFLNAVLAWGGRMIDVELSFEIICSYVFMPFAFIMGVAWDDCFEVAELLGIKTFVNEFAAYEQLSKLIKNRRQTLPGTKLSLRSEIIATYALCGFANIGSLGVQIGGLSALAPSRRPDFASLAVRALVAGTIACFMTACIAGILYEEGNDDSTIPLGAVVTTIASNITSTILPTVK